MESRLKKFDYYSDEYFTFDDAYVGATEVGQYALLNREGKNLMKDYYADKYSTNMQMVYSTQMQTLVDMIGAVQTQARDEQNYRKAFIIDIPSSTGFHSVPIIYIKENGQEGLLISDSNGSRIMSDYENFAKELLAKTKIPSYITTVFRQQDGFSCHVDAILYAMYSTARDEHGNYLSKDLLKVISEGAENKGAYHAVKALVTVFLKTAQIEDFVKRYAQSEQAFAEATLFLKKHQKTIKGCERVYDDYLRKKGLKFARLVEIQFYAQQIKKEISEDSWKDYRKAFIQKAKQILKTDDYDKHEQLYSFACDFSQDPKGAIESQKSMRTKPTGSARNY